jgi:hypothetical protein
MIFHYVCVNNSKSYFAVNHLPLSERHFIRHHWLSLFIVCLLPRQTFHLSRLTCNSDSHLLVLRRSSISCFLRYDGVGKQLLVCILGVACCHECMTAPGKNAKCRCAALTSDRPLHRRLTGKQNPAVWIDPAGLPRHGLKRAPLSVRCGNSVGCPKFPSSVDRARYRSAEDAFHLFPFPCHEGPRSSSQDRGSLRCFGAS